MANPSDDPFEFDFYISANRKNAAALEVAQVLQEAGYSTYLPARKAEETEADRIAANRSTALVLILTKDTEQAHIDLNDLLNSLSVGNNERRVIIFQFEECEVASLIDHGFIVNLASLHEFRDRKRHILASVEELPRPARASIEIASNSKTEPRGSEPVAPRRAPRIDSFTEEHGVVAPQLTETPPRPQREALNALSEDIASHPISPAPPVSPTPPRVRHAPLPQPADARVAEVRAEHRTEPRVQAQPAAAEPSAADESLAEMAQRLEAASCKPKATASPAPPEAYIPRMPAAPAPAPPEPRALSVRHGIDELQTTAEAPARDDPLESLEAITGYRKERKKKRKTLEKDIVECGVSYPTRVAIDIPFVIDVLIYRQAERWSAIELALKANPDNDQFRFAGATEVTRGTTLSVTLALPWHTEPQAQTVCWNGETTSVSFRVVPTKAYSTRAVHGLCKIAVDGLTIGQVFFQMKVDQNGVTDDWRMAHARFVQSAFASYASKDRRRVLARFRESKS
jgi:hypothetical protein